MRAKNPLRRLTLNTHNDGNGCISRKALAVSIGWTGEAPILMSCAATGQRFSGGHGIAAAILG